MKSIEHRLEEEAQDYYTSASTADLLEEAAEVIREMRAEIQMYEIQEAG